MLFQQTGLYLHVSLISSLREWHCVFFRARRRGDVITPMRCALCSFSFCTFSICSFLSYSRFCIIHNFLTRFVTVKLIYTISLRRIRWTISLFKTGYQKVLGIEDLFDPLTTDQSTLLGDRLEKWVSRNYATSWIKREGSLGIYYYNNISIAIIIRS